MLSTMLVVAALSLYLRSVLAWGDMGHEAIAYIAQDFVSSKTTTFVQNALSDTSTNYMANAATWADTYRYTSAGSWSKPLHFIDANDSPPTSCSVEFDRDCEDNSCVVAAITNYTAQLQDSSTSTSELLNAMRFVIHFVGDIHQPLHDEALDVGGNTIDVTYDGDSTNLHHIWDTEIPEQLAGGSTQAVARTFATSLTSAINGGSYGWNTSSWLDGMTLTDTQSSAMTWASQANAFVCSDVLVDGVSAVESGDLDGTYYTRHVDVARTQIARAGYRLGAWLNLIVTGSMEG